MTQEEYEWRMATFARFLELGPQVWRNWDFLKERVRLSFEVLDMRKSSGNRALACITFRGSGNVKRPKAVGRSVLVAMPVYDLVLSNELMHGYTGEKLDKILLHELVHLGYAGHGRDFKAVCKEVGGVLYGAAASETAQFFLQQKQPNGRYAQASPKFDTEDAAMAWFREPAQVEARAAQGRAWLAANPGKKHMEARKALMWRLVSG